MHVAINCQKGSWGKLTIMNEVRKASIWKLVSESLEGKRGIVENIKESSHVPAFLLFRGTSAHCHVSLTTIIVRWLFPVWTDMEVWRFSCVTWDEWYVFCSSNNRVCSRRNNRDCSIILEFASNNRNFGDLYIFF